MKPAAALLLATTLLAGCGREPMVPGQATPAEGGDEPTTAQALAFVAAEHAGAPASATAETDASEEFKSQAVGTELRYGSTGEYDGDMLVVAVGIGLDPALMNCNNKQHDSLAGCVETDQGILLWEGEAPEEDPGVVYVLVDKGDAAALLFYAGPAITDDPRTLDMPITTDTLFAIANDPRVNVTTSQAAIDSGTDLAFWKDAR